MGTTQSIDMRPNLADLEQEIQILRDSKESGLRVNANHLWRLCKETILNGRILVRSHGLETKNDPHFVSWHQDIADDLAASSFMTGKEALAYLLRKFDRRLSRHPIRLTAINGETAGRVVQRASCWRVDDAVYGPRAATVHAFGRAVLDDPAVVAFAKERGIQLGLGLWEGGAA